MKKNIIVITGGAGFVGTNLIKYFVKNTKFKIDKLRTGKKIMVGMGLPMVLSLFEYRMFGVYENEEGLTKEKE